MVFLLFFPSLYVLDQNGVRRTFESLTLYSNTRSLSFLHYDWLILIVSTGKRMANQQRQLTNKKQRLDELFAAGLNENKPTDAIAASLSSYVAEQIKDSMVRLFSNGVNGQEQAAIVEFSTEAERRLDFLQSPAYANLSQQLAKFNSLATGQPGAQSEPVRPPANDQAPHPSQPRPAALPASSLIPTDALPPKSSLKKKKPTDELFDGDGSNDSKPKSRTRKSSAKDEPKTPPSTAPPKKPATADDDLMDVVDTNKANGDKKEEPIELDSRDDKSNEDQSSADSESGDSDKEEDYDYNSDEEVIEEKKATEKKPSSKRSTRAKKADTNGGEVDIKKPAAKRSRAKKSGGGSAKRTSRKRARNDDNENGDHENGGKDSAAAAAVAAAAAALSEELPKPPASKRAKTKENNNKEEPKASTPLPTTPTASTSAATSSRPTAAATKNTAPLQTTPLQLVPLSFAEINGYICPAGTGDPDGATHSLEPVVIDAIIDAGKDDTLDIDKLHAFVKTIIKTDQAVTDIISSARLSKAIETPDTMTRADMFAILLLKCMDEFTVHSAEGFNILLARSQQ